jgi:protein TonB
VASGDGALALAVPRAGGADGAAATAQYRPYYEGMRREIARALRYPSAARRQGLSGTVELEVEVRPSGAVGAVAIVRSSSHRVLDDAALEAARGLPRMPFPPGLPPRTLRVRIPVDFELR